MSGTSLTNPFLTLPIRRLATVTNATSSASGAAGGTLSASHTTDAETKTLVVIIRTLQDGAGAAEAVSGITFNGVALTSRVAVKHASSKRAVEIWTLTDPAIGAFTLEVTYDGSAASDSRSWTAANYNNGSTIGANSNTGSTGTAQSTSITTTVDSSMVVGGGFGVGGDTDPYTPGTDVNEFADGDTGADAAEDHGYWAADKLADAAGAYTLDETASASDGWSVVAIELKP